MGKKKYLTPQDKDYDIYQEVDDHYIMWKEDNDTRMFRENGWNDVTDAYWGKLPDDWPFNSRVIDPRIRTTLIEKNGRIINSKLRGRVVPREGGDVISGSIQNALLDFQWDSANDGGSMLEKWGEMDMDTRMYASKFGYVPWKYQCDKEGKVIFDGNEFYPLDIRDCGMDASATHIRDAKWFQHRKWVTLDELTLLHDSDSKEPMYPGLPELLEKIQLDDKAMYRSDRRDGEYTNRILSLKSLPDRVGEDKSFPVCEIVTEYRTDRFITFAPKYRVILRDIKNPYKHKKIPIVQNRYYKISGDPIGESEVEPVLPLWRAIQANICGYLDTMMIHMRPPLKILEGMVRLETVIFEPEGQMLMDRADAVTEFQGSPQPMQLFQTTHSALVAAYNQAMGDFSQQVSNADPFNGGEKPTAREVSFVDRQQNSRDQKNQNSLGDCIQDMMSMWISNNQQFLFVNTEKKEYLLKILGGELFSYFERAGLSEEEVSPESMTMLKDIIMQDPNLSDEDILTLHDSAKQPKFPVIDDSDLDDVKIKPKMKVNDMGDGAELYIVPEDLVGLYDYIPDVQSMSAGAIRHNQDSMKNLYDIITSPNTSSLLAQDGWMINVKEVITDLGSAIGRNDTEKYFKKIEQQPQLQPEQGASPLQNSPVGGLPTDSLASLGGVMPTQEAQPLGLSQSGGVL